MKTMMNRRLGLALIAAGVSWPSLAAAQPETRAALSEAFSSARARLLDARPLIAEMGKAPARRIAANPWPAIVDKIREKGKFFPATPISPPFFSLADIQGAAEADHAANYVNIAGSLDDDGIFHPEEGRFASDDWKLGTDGNWRIDQWQFELYLDDGSIVPEGDNFHNSLVETASGVLVDMKTQRLKAADPSAKAKHASLMALWSAFQRNDQGGK